MAWLIIQEKGYIFIRKLFSLLFLVPANSNEINPETFIDSKAQSMVQVIVNNPDLFEISDCKNFGCLIFNPTISAERVEAKSKATLTGLLSLKSLLTRIPIFL